MNTLKTILVTSVAILAGAIISLPVISSALSVSVPSAPGQGYTLAGQSTGNYQATSTLFVSSKSNVGIGTTIPASLLDISGSSGLTFRNSGLSAGFNVSDRNADPGRQLIFAGNTGAYSVFNVVTTNSSLASPATNAVALWTSDIRNDSANAMQFQLANNATYGSVLFNQAFGSASVNNISFQTGWSQATTPNQLVLQVGGNVGIDAANPTLGKLQIGDGASGPVYGAMNSSAGQQGLFTFYDASTAKWSFGKQTDNSFLIFDNVAGRSAIQAMSNGDLYLQQSGGNVGIGTTNPLNKLQVNTGTDLNFGIRAGIADTTAIAFQTFTDNGLSNIPLEFRASKTNFAVGNVGIGTTTPATKLDVNGAIVSEESKASSSATPTFDWSAANQYEMTLTANVTSITFSNLQPGAGDRLILCQDGTGGRTVAGWDSKILWSGGTVPTQTSTANKCDLYTFTVTNGTSTLRALGGVVQNY